MIVSNLLKIDPPDKIICNNKLRKWATENAYTLIFLSSMFIITWIIQGVLAWVR